MSLNACDDLTISVIKRNPELGTNLGEKALSHLGGSRRSQGPTGGRASIQLAAFSGRLHED